MYSLLFNELREPIKFRSTVYTRGVWICNLWFSYLCRTDVSVSPIARVVSLCHTNLFLSALRLVLAIAGCTAYSKLTHFLLRCHVSGACQAIFGEGAWDSQERWCWEPTGVAGTIYLEGAFGLLSRLHTSRLLGTTIVSSLCVSATQGALPSSCPFIWFS